MKSTGIAVLLAIVSTLCIFAGPVAAQGYPARPITMVVGYPAGSGLDAVARFLADGIKQQIGQPVVVENKPGAVGNIAAQAVAHARPDGYTMLFTANSTHAANVHLFRKLGFDPVKDFAPLTTIASLGFVLIVNPETVPVQSVSELTAYIKARPGKIAYGAGNATGRIATEWYRSATGFEALFIPYTGVPPAITDLIAGRIQFMVADATFALAQVRGGKVRALAVTTAHRLSSAPEIPTMAEAGIAGYDIGAWFATFLPAGAPADIVASLTHWCNTAMGSDHAREFLRPLGAEPFPGSPESLARFVQSETEKWGKIVRFAGIQAE